jgi:hypothetical protein
LNSLYEQLQHLSEQVRRRQPHIRGEESTKQALIVPFLSVLGYDVHDPTELQPEYIADFAKKRPGGPMEKVDYAIRKDGHPVIFIECKAVDCDPRLHGGQLARYFNATPSVPIAIVTNGVRYMFFTDLEERNILSEQPFFQFNVFDFSANDVEVLESFGRARFDPATIRDRVEEIIYINKITGFIGEILRNPTESFTRFVLSELDLVSGKKLTARLVEKFVPTIRRAIQTSLLDMATRSIREQVADKPEPASALISAVAAAPAAAPLKNEGAAPVANTKPAATPAGVVTTPEELEAFEIVKLICADSPLAAMAPVLFRDTSGYFNIYAGSVRKSFVRLYFSQRRKAITTKVLLARAAPLAHGFEVEAFQEGSRVFVHGPKDLHRLRPLLLVAYEEEVKRKDSGEGEPEGGVVG